MGKRIFTSEQLSAIETRNKSLLVSAAAGSGKTATLTERIIRSLTDDENPEDISRMLIVTFTNAAVAELRERITAAIKAKLAQEPQNRRLEHQLYMLPSAHISTIDSFCNDILKNNAERFGISPKYRIADPIEAEILSRSTLTALIGAAYNGELSDVTTPEEFEELASCLVGVKNDAALEEIFEFLYDKSKSLEDGVGIYRKFTERLSGYVDIPIEKNIYGEFAMRRAKEAALHYLEVTKKLISDLDPDDKYLSALSDDISALENIIDADTYSKMKAALNHKFVSLPTVRGEKTEAQQNTVDVRTNMKKAISESIAKRYFEYSEEEWKAHIKELEKLLSTLTAFLERFDGIYFEEKKSRAMLEYSDIERLAYLALFNADGSPSELALSERDKYTSVYIDEYQDVNVLQNKIFLAVSRPSNRFTVGDIKQSIYGFRSACPDIFADMKNKYPKLERADGSDTASIFMSKNFRCDRGIVDFTNCIFDNMFDLCRDSIGYVKEDRLEFAKIYDSAEPRYTPPTVKLFAKSDVISDSSDEELEVSSGELSPIWVAQKIASLISDGKLNSGEPIHPKDVAIIIRKDHGRSKVYADALEAVGIKATTPENRDFFLNSEIQLVLCLLNSINNPMKDIYLAGLMLSPLFGFTADELFLARKLGGASLWDSIKRYAQAAPTDTKFSLFINTLNRYRAISEGMQADALLLRLYSETGLLALSAKDGLRENLMLLYNYARKFEASSYQGLYNFINYINTVIESGASFSSQKETEAEDAVTITTVHKSKGLEYPIVFLTDASSPLISQNERNARIAYSDEFGMAMKTRVPGGLALVESPIHNVIIDRNLEKSIEEELRVYYVALTRAREQLYIVGAPRIASKEEYESRAKLRNIHRSSYTLKELKSFIDILYSQKTNAILEWQEDSDEKLDGSHEKEADNFAQKANVQNIHESVDDKLYSLLSERFNFKYPNKHLTLLPEKLSISTLYPTVLDGADEDVSTSIDRSEAPPRRKLGSLPEFITGTEEKESAKRGIATHNFLQFFDIDSFSALGADGELSRLVNDGYISKDNSERVRLDEIIKFYDSALYQEMKSAKKLYREFRFSVMLPAHHFTANEEKKLALKDEKILLQGVIDCIVEDAEGRLHLIDYKTDRLTKKELEDKTLAQKTLSEKHSLQLSYYALAIEKIFGKYPETTRIYSLPLGDTVEALS